MTKTEILNDRSAFQRVCDAYVRRNVLYCVSTLICKVREIAESDDDYDTYLNLTSGKPDYEEAARAFIMDDADLDDLENIADQNGWWPNVLTDLGVPETVDVDEWFKANRDVEGRVRQAVWDITDDSDGTKWVCETFNLDPEYQEIFEHYIVDRYFGARLKERGEIVEDYLGMLIWGRTTTGQAISMDGVIEEMVRGLDEDHWVWKEV